MTHKPSSLRKAAVLITALDTEAADRLLDQMGPEQATKVRNAIMQLGTISDEEQEVALAEFFGHSSTDNHEVEWEISEQALALSASTSPGYQAAANPAFDVPSPGQFEFLSMVPMAELYQFFQREHPQTIALVIVLLPAEQGAELVRQFNQELQAEIIERLEYGFEAEPEVIAEVEQALRKAFARYVRSSEMHPQRREHIAAILKRLAPSPQVMPTSEEACEPISSVERETTPVDHESPDSSPALTLAHAASAWEEETPAMEFEELLSLPTHRFFAVFEEADPSLVMLALTGASRRLFERFVAQFTPERAAEFERHLEQLRPFPLRDVSHAQRELAKIAAGHRASANHAAENSRSLAAVA
jgi:flagellar motor switch protein FliG